MTGSVKLETMVDEAVDRRLEEIAASHGIGKAELVADVLRDFTTTDPEYAAFVEVGLKDWREGRLLEHDDVVAHIKRVLAE